jgi:hypothetical protein
MPIDKGTTLPITQVTGLQINYRDANSCLNPPIVTTQERDKLVNSNDPDQPIKDGTIVFNSDSNVMEFYQGSTDTWKSAVEGNGDVVGPANSINNNLVAFDGITGKAIKDGGVAANNVVTSTNNGTDLRIAIYDGDSKKIKAGGVTIEDLQVVNSKDKAINATPLYKMSNLGALQFGSNDNVADTGVILVDGLTPVTFQTQGVGVDAQVCTIINGELGAGSSSPSALLEINSTTGGFLLSRLTTDQINALVSPKDGMVVYDTILKQTRFRQNGQWVSGNIDNLTLKVTSVTTNYYQPTKDDCIINVDVTGVTGTTTIDLFSPNNVPLGIVYIIKDKTGQASTKNIKISTVAGFRIDKDYDYTINTDYGWVEVFNNGQNWGIISESPPSAGNVVGPASSVINNIPTFNNTTGTLIKDSGLNLSQIVSKYLPFSAASFISTYNILDNDFFVVIYAASGGTTVNLPSLGISSNINRLIIIKQAGVGTTTIRPNDIDSIQSQDQSKCVLSTDGYVWLVGTANRYWMPICSGVGI